MSLLNMCNRVIRRAPSSRRSPVRRRPCALVLEPLEDRFCPSGWTSIGPIGSPAFAEAIDPSHPDTIYAGYEGAGIRRSTDGGKTWSDVSPRPAAQVYAIQLDPTDPQTLYAAGGGSVFKSTNGGQSWNSIGPSGSGGPSLVLDPSDPQTIYSGGAAGTGGLFKSIDGGTHWGHADNGIVGWVISVVIDPLDPDVLYAGTGGTSGNGILGEGVFKSTDGGGHWSEILPSTSGVKLALDPSDPDIVYAGNADGVFKSYDGGATWFRPIGFSPDDVASLVVDPAHPHTLYAGTLDAGVFQSTDGGATWHTGGLSTELILSLAVDPVDSATVYAGTGTGPYVSHDAGSSWSPLDDDLRAHCRCYGVEGVTVDPTDSNVVYVTSLDGGGLVTRDGGATWSALTGGLASMSPKHITFEPHDPTIAYSGSNGWAGPGGVFKSTDGGQIWSHTNLGPPGIYVWTLGEDPNDSNTLYAGTSGGRGLFKTTDGGDSWTAINNGLLLLQSSVVVVDPNDSNTVYFGISSTQGGLFKSTNGGSDWSPRLAGLSLRSLAIDPQDSQIIYAGIGAPSGQGVFKSTDGGQSWSAMNNGLTNLTISRSRGILIDPTDSNTLYVGTEGGGVFMSTDAGAHWTPINDGLSDLTVYSMAMDPENPHTIYAGTLTSSVFVLHVPPRAVVQSVLVNDGSAQRSMVTSPTVSFSTQVTTDPGAFELARQGGGVIDVNVAESIVDGRSVDTLTFAEAGLAVGSLPDGQHRQFALPSAPTTLTPENVERLDQLFAAGREEGTSLVLPGSKRGQLSVSEEDGLDADL